MKLKIKGTEFTTHMAPLRAVDKTNESINCDLTEMAIVQDDKKKYLLAKTTQPHYTTYLKLNLSGEPDSDDPLKAGIDRDAVVCADNEHYTVKNSEFMTLLRNVGASETDFVVTEDGMSAVTDKALNFLIPATHNKKQGLQIPSITDILSSADHDLTTGIMDGNDLADALKSTIAVAKLGAKTCSLYDRAVHLTLGKEDFGLEAFSGTATVRWVMGSDPVTHAKWVKGSDPVTHPVLHLSLSPQSAQALMQVCALTERQAEWVYDAAAGQLLVWCMPYFICIKTEDIGYQEVPVSVPDYSQLSVNRIQLANAVRLAKNTGRKMLNFHFYENGNLEVCTQDNAFSDSFQGDHTGNQYCGTVSLPIDALSACLSGCLSKDIVLHCDPEYDYIVLSTKDGLVCAIDEGAPTAPTAPNPFPFP